MGVVARRAWPRPAWAWCMSLLLLAPTAASAQQSLTVAAFPDVDKAVRAALPAWKRLHPDVEIKLVVRQYADHHTAMTTALSTSVYLPDVMALEVNYVGRFAQGMGLDDLSKPPYDMRPLADRYVPYALAQATNRRGQIVAAPSDIGPSTLLYRADLLARAGLNEAELTRDMDSYIAAGKKIKLATGAYLLSHAREMKDLLIRVGIQPGQGLYFDKDSNVLVNSPRFERAFRLAREVRRNQLDAKTLWWSTDWSEGLRRGTQATLLAGAWMAGHLSNWIAPATTGLWRAAQLPEGLYAADGGSFFAIARGAPAANKQLAWEFIKLMTLDRTVQLDAFKRINAFPALVSTFDDPFFDEPIPFLGGEPARQLWREAARHITAVTVHKQDAFAAEVIDTELDKVLTQDKDIATALADAERLLRKRAHR